MPTFSRKTNSHKNLNQHMKMDWLLPSCWLVAPSETCAKQITINPIKTCSQIFNSSLYSNSDLLLPIDLISILFSIPFIPSNHSQNHPPIWKWNQNKNHIKKLSKRKTVPDLINAQQGNNWTHLEPNCHNPNKSPASKPYRDTKVH